MYAAIPDTCPLRGCVSITGHDCAAVVQNKVERKAIKLNPNSVDGFIFKGCSWWISCCSGSCLHYPCILNSVIHDPKWLQLRGCHHHASMATGPKSKTRETCLWSFSSVGTGNKSQPEVNGWNRPMKLAHFVIYFLNELKCAASLNHFAVHYRCAPYLNYCVVGISCSNCAWSPMQHKSQSWNGRGISDQFALPLAYLKPAAEWNLFIVSCGSRRITGLLSSCG